MPAPLPRSELSCPSWRWSSSGWACAGVTSVKTAMGSEEERDGGGRAGRSGSELEDFPDPRAGAALGQARAGATGRFAAGVGDDDLVVRGLGELVLHRDLLGLAAHLQFLDAHLVVLRH